MIALSPRVSLYPRGAPVPRNLGEDHLALAHVPESGAFGDGSHPTTRLCAGAVDWFCRTQKPRAVLDVGTGTGVLARIARARGAQLIVATDIDPQAIESARAHVGLDSPDLVAIEITDSSPDLWGPRFDLVVANILEAPLRELAIQLARALAPGGVLLLSGFTPLQAPGLRVAYESAGVKFINESHLEEWALLCFKASGEAGREPQ
jgi:ribosomal protein L11 methyltransferase